ncbi:Conidiation protein 6-domain-containing protein [Lactarius sanguifluus]|nr:Conidiation protein 6-domain-containing protein [Lactarius sanguifluus]
MSESQNRVVGGHKAAMHNPNVSAEAKEHSRQVAEGVQGSDAVQDDYSTKPSLATGDKEESRVIGGYKAALKNPNVSEEAKERAQQILEDKDAL